MFAGCVVERSPMRAATSFSGRPVTRAAMWLVFSQGPSPVREAPVSKQLMSLLAAWGGVLDRDQSKRPPAVCDRQ